MQVAVGVVDCFQALHQRNPPVAQAGGKKRVQKFSAIVLTEASPPWPGSRLKIEPVYELKGQNLTLSAQHRLSGKLTQLR